MVREAEDGAGVAADVASTEILNMPMGSDSMMGRTIESMIADTAKPTRLAGTRRTPAVVTATETWEGIVVGTTLFRMGGIGGESATGTMTEVGVEIAVGTSLTLVGETTATSTAGTTREDGRGNAREVGMMEAGTIIVMSCTGRGEIESLTTTDTTIEDGVGSAIPVVARKLPTIHTLLTAMVMMEGIPATMSPEMVTS